MKKVLLMTDFSAASERAINYALSILNDMPCEFTLFHAYNFTTTPQDAITFIDARLREDAEKALNKYKKTLEKRDDLPYHTFKTEVIGVSAESAAFMLNERNHYDLIVVGASGSGENIFLGSVATNIIRNVPTNTLVVPSTQRAMPIKNIALSVDYQEVSSFSIYDFLKDLADRKNAEITLLTILKENQKPTDLDSFVKYQYHDSFKNFKTFDYFIKDEDVQEGIEDYLNNHRVDMLVLVSRHHTFYDVVFNRSLTRKMVYKPNIPILSVYDRKTDDYLMEIHSEDVVTF